MNKQSRLFGGVFFLFVLSIVFSGCSKNETDLVKATLKTMNSTSYENNLNLILKTDAKAENLENWRNEDLKIFKGLTSVTMDVYSKVSRSADDLVNSQESKFAINIGGISANASVWGTTDFSNDKKDFMQVLKFPPIFSMAFPFKFAGREYFVIDSKDVLTMQKDLEKIPDNKLSLYSNFKQFHQSFAMLNGQYMQNITKDSTAFVESFITTYNPGIETITNKGITVYQGEECTSYELNLGDKKAKDLAKSMILAFADSKEIRDLLKKRVKLIANFPISDSQMDEFFGNSDSNISDFKKGVYDFFESLEDVKLFGEDGISINFMVNNQGYLVGIGGIIDLELSKKEFEKMDKKDNSAKGQLKNASDEMIMLKFNFSSTYKNINKPLNIDIPIIPENDKFSIKDILDNVKEQQLLQTRQRENQEKELELLNAKKGKITLKFNGQRISGYNYDDYDYSESSKYNRNPNSNDVLVVNDRIMFPIAPILDRMDVQYVWDAKRREIICYRGQDTIIFTPDKNQVEINGVKKDIDLSPRLINGRTYIPIRTICDLYGAELKWDSELKVVDILYSMKVSM